MGSENSSGGAGGGVWAQVGGPTLGPSGWAHAGPTWVGPSWAHVGGPKLGPSGWAHAGPKWVGPSWAQVGPSQKFGTPKKSKNQKFSKSKSVLPKMSARFFYAGKRRPRPIWGPPGQFFAWAGKIEKMQEFRLFSLVGTWDLFTRFGALAAIHPRWGNRYRSICQQIALWP